jgi:glutamate-ammonia-ligase adenylyltransferase
MIAPKSKPAVPLWRRLRTAPRLAEFTHADVRLDDFLSAETDELQALAGHGPVRALLLALADHSPFLWRLVTADPARLAKLLNASPEQSLADCLAQLMAICDEASSEAAIMRALRRAKQETALLIALADLGGVWDIVEVTQALSQAADVFIGCALRFVLREIHDAGRMKLEDRSKPETGCGLVVLALGKLGANELNYSSDVDLVVLFDPACPALAEKVEPAPLFVRLTRQLVKLLQERTHDGYVLRVDLRLRPDPGSTAVAISLPTAYAYYEILGQNWERAALIKARPAAGDIALGTRFLETLAAFIWRKYFDYAAIADIHAMKRQIHDLRGHAEVTIAGHDIKLGRGGIREIEFFVQTQQLVFGGKRPRLRGRRTLEMLEELGHDGWVTRAAVTDLRKAYCFLRRIEHRLQMIADEQTQRLPTGMTALRSFARFCGYAGERRFAIELMHHLHLVSFHYALLFEHAPGLDAAIGSLVFTGVGDDPETIETLIKLGFKKPSLVVEIVRGWHFGHHAGLRSSRAREVLTELVPRLIEAFAGSGDPDAALAAFDSALARMPAAVELLSILKSHRRLCGLFADILGGAPRLARLVMRTPHVLDATIDGNALNASIDEQSFRQRAEAFLATRKSTEEFLDSTREFAQEELFRIGLRLFSGMIEPSSAGEAYSALAACLVEASFAHVEEAFAREHGRVPGGSAIVLGLGKLGSREMTAASDLDLILIYDFDPQAPQSDGARSLHAVQYYTRIAQRLVSALTVATRRGRLYEVDMRLRPSGRKGPVATQFKGFIEYQSNEAETWEHMALTRARVVAGDASLADRARAAICTLIQQPRGKTLRRDVFAMRSLVAKVKGEKDPWDLKLVAGGLMDIEFLAQYLVLQHAHAQPDMIAVATLAMLENAARLGVLDGEDARRLMQAHRLYTNVTQMLRLTLDSGKDPHTASEAVNRRLAKIADVPSFSVLERELHEARIGVRRIFNMILTSD